MRIARNELARLLAATVKVVEARNTIPILSTVRLVAAYGTLTATATDLDVAVTASTAADGEFSACIDARMIGDIVRKLPTDAEVDIDVDGNIATLKAGRARFKLPVLPVSDFPNIEHGAYDAEFDADLAALFAPVKFAISSEEQRYYLNGVFLHVADGRLAAVATDGHRLARHIGQEIDVAFAGIIVPRKMSEIMPSGTVSVAVSGTKIRVVSDGAVFVSKLIDGTFPDYLRVIPTGNDNLARADKAALAAATDRVAIVSAAHGSGVRMAVGGGAIVLTVRGVAEATDSVPCDYDGEEIVIGFNSRYVTEALSVFGNGDVTLALADAGSPARLTGSPDGLDVVLMPMRV